MEDKLLTPGQLLGLPGKVWGITIQTSYWEGQWHQNCGYTSPILFLGTDKEISEKRNFFVNCSIPKNFQRENFPGQVATESLRTKDSENLYERGVQKIVDPDLVAQSECHQMRSVSKNMRCHKKYISHNLRNLASPRKSLLPMAVLFFSKIG